MSMRFYRFLSVFALFLLLSVGVIVPKVAAAGKCDIGSPEADLGDCLLLNKEGQTVKDVYPTPSVLINLVTKNIFIFGGIILFIMIIYSGYQLIIGGTKGQEQAKNVMTTAITGFIIMFAAYWIIQIIQVLTGVQIFSV